MAPRVAAWIGAVLLGAVLPASAQDATSAASGPAASPDVTRPTDPPEGVIVPPGGGEAQAQTAANPFTLPAHAPDFERSRGLHCDVLKHLKTPRTYRRLDAYMRPSAFWPQDNSSAATRDFMTGDWGGVREKWYEKGIDLYGCFDFDIAADTQDNFHADVPVLARGAHYTSERNYVPTWGLDLYSHLWHKKGGQIHASFTWPHTHPMYAYGNRLNPTGTDRIHGQYYTEIGLGDPTDLDQGVRLFELWYQQTYGPNGRDYIRFGNIFPIIQISRSILSDLFNIWTFTEPCMLGTTYFTGNAPCYPQAPLGVQWYHIINNSWEVSAQVQQGYYASSGRNNIRGVNWNIKASDGVETITEFTRKGGTYNLNPKDNGLPWFLKLGIQTHTGPIYADNIDVNGGRAGLTGLPKKTLHGNSQVYVFYEQMLYREKGSYGQGLTGFVKTGGGFYNDRNVLKRWFATGLGYEGLFRGRDRDVLYGGWAFVRATPGFVQFQTDNSPCRLVPGCVITGRQDVMEAGYSMELRPWFWTTPVWQWYHHPNVRSDLGDIQSVGITTKISF